MTDIPPVLLSATHMQIQTEANIHNDVHTDFTDAQGTLILTDIPPVLLSATHMQIQTEANIPNPYIQRKDFTPTKANTNSNNTQRQA